MNTFIDRLYAFDGSNRFIYRKHCPYADALGMYPNINGQAGCYYLYSASRQANTWHLKASRAWDDLPKPRPMQTITITKLFNTTIDRQTNQ